MKSGEYEDFKYTSIKKYTDGVYYLNDNKLYINNINTKEIKEYKNPGLSEFLTLSELGKDRLLYYFINDYFRIYDLDNNKVKLFDYRINDDVDKVYLKDNLLFLISNSKVYVIKLDEIETKEMSYEELESEFESKLISKIEKLQTDYNVDFKISKDANLKFKIWKESTKGETDYNSIMDSLDYTEEVFKMFGSEFFKEFIHDDYTGMRIYLVSEIKSEDFSKGGEAFRYYDKYAIIANSVDYKRTLCHEIMHSMEDAVSAKKKTMFKKWKDYNPKGYKYKVDYDQYASSYQYSITYGKGDIYFIDNYAQTNELEDRARIFENICMNTPEDIKKYPFILKKAEYEEEEIKKFYPMLEDSIIFDSLK